MKENVERLKELRLYGMLQSLDYRLSEVCESNLSHQDFLNLILEDESLYRKNKRSERLNKRARFNSQSSLESFEADVKRGVSKTLIKELSSLKFISNHQNLLLIGGTGVGKSYLSQGVGHTACLNGYETFFISVNKLFKEVEAQEASGKYLGFLNKLKRVKLLILDDFGLRNYSHEEATVLYDILEDRYNQSSTVVTSQVKSEGWKLLFEDAVIAEAIVDRLISCAHKIELKGLSYRKKHLPK